MVTLFIIVIGVCVLLPEYLLHVQDKRRKRWITDVQR